MPENSHAIELAAQIASAYVSNNSVRASDLPILLGDIHAALVRFSSGSTSLAAESAKPTPAATVKKSVTKDYLVCLEDGRKFKSLKRHLRSAHDLTPEQYRQKWGLPSDYPMTAPSYSKVRSALARDLGLGRQGHGTTRGSGAVT